MLTVLADDVQLRAASLVARYDQPGPRYTSYPPVPRWSKAFGDADFLEALDATGPTDPFALYVHLPFCAARCFYCGCNAVVTARDEIVHRYLDRLDAQVQRIVERLGPGRRVTQLHWGGGTPNFLGIRAMDRTWRMLARHFDIAPDAELSVECDPRLTSSEQLHHLRRLGFSRVSFGVQDLDPDVQREIGRVQPAEMVREVIDWSRDAGFEGVNVDLVYGLPGQTVETLERTMDRVLEELHPDRVACFGYAHVPWAHPHQRQIDESHLPDGDARFGLFSRVVRRFTGAGYQWIGFDHFALPDDALAVAQREGRLHRNFMGYTTMPGDHLLGFGMSSISDVANRYAQADGSLTGWSKAMDAGQLGIVKGLSLTADEVRRRRAIMRLLCDLRIAKDDLPGDPTLAWRRLVPLAHDGLVELTGAEATVTPLGRYFLRNVCMAIDTALETGTARYSRTI
ncbi:MAG: oxygen-independent coproporphyrinogen III oxidase [Gemmatimonadetes bacterium]|nr:oxygen-independent coproporphyrinogen III oxidase [Gemmatimonadota bacterium]